MDSGRLRRRSTIGHGRDPNPEEGTMNDGTRVAGGASSPVPTGEEARTGSATLRPYLLGGLAALSAGAAAIHFAVVFEHFAEYAPYGVFFLVISWAQVIWPVVLLWRL